MSKQAFDDLLCRYMKRKKHFHGFAYLKQGQVIFSENYAMYDRGQLHPVFSITKSITAYLVLACASSNQSINLGLPIFNADDLANYDIDPMWVSHWLEITPQHCLDMKTGILWNEIEHFNSPQNPFKSWILSENTIAEFLKSPFENRPGVIFNYNSAVSHILGWWLSQTMNKSLDQIANEYLFEPMGIIHYFWEKDLMDRVYGGHGLWLSFDDIIKVAIVLTQMDEHQLKPTMTALHLKASDAIRGYSGYGNGCWHINCANRHWLGAFGHGGQRIYWSKQTQEAIVFLGAVSPEFGLQERLIEALFE